MFIFRPGGLPTSVLILLVYSSLLSCQHQVQLNMLPWWRNKRINFLTSYFKSGKKSNYYTTHLEINNIFWEVNKNHKLKISGDICVPLLRGCFLELGFSWSCISSSKINYEVWIDPLHRRLILTAYTLRLWKRPEEKLSKEVAVSGLPTPAQPQQQEEASIWSSPLILYLMLQ